MADFSDDDGIIAALQQQATMPDASSADNTPMLNNPYLAAQMNQESGGQDYDKSGNILTSPKGAKGRMQVLDSTNLDPGFGVTPAKDNSVEERARVGRDYSSALQTHYGDPALGLAAYNWGPGNVDRWLKNGADINQMPDETKTYVKNILGGANTGKQYASADTGIQTDAMPDNSVPIDNSDLDKMSPDELQAEIAKLQSDQPASDNSDLDNMSPAELQAEIAKLQGGPSDLPGLAGIPNMTAPTAQANPTAGLMLAGTAAKPDFMARQGADWAKRNQQAGDIVDAVSTQNPQETTLQAAGNIAGRAVDLGGNLIGSDLRTIRDLTIPQAAQDQLSDVAKAGAKYIGGTDIGSLLPGAMPMGETVGQGAKDASGLYGEFAKNQPAAARDISAVNNILQAAPALEGVGAAAKGTAGLVGDALEGLGEGADVSSNNFLSNVSVGRRAAAPSMAVPTADELRANAGATYRGLAGDSQALDSSGTDKFLDQIKALTPQTEAGKIVSGDNTLTTLVDRMAGKVDPETGERVGGLQGKPLSLAEAQEIDEALGDHIDSLTDGTTGRLTKQGKKVQDVQMAFRKAIDESGTEGGDQLKLARAQWAQAARMSDVERIINRAQMMDNPVTGIKTGFRTLVNNPNRMRGFTPVETALIKRAANTGIVTNTLRTLGSRLGPIGAGVAGGAVGGPLGAAIGFGTDSLLSGTARSAANALQMRKANAITRAIAERKMPEVAAAAAPAIEEAAPAVTQHSVPGTLNPVNQALAENTFHPHPDHMGLNYLEADAIGQSRENNYNPETAPPKDQAYDQKVASDLYGTGAQKKERRMDIVMGPPGAGKSSALVDPLIKKHGGKLIDSDDVKPKLQGFDNGLGANQVHERSKWITEHMPNNLLEKAVNSGDNIVYPVVGKDLGRLQATIDKFHALRYNVNVHLADIPTDESIKRVIDRFGRTGRTVPLNYVRSIGDKPRNVFNEIIKGDKVNDYSHYNTNVAYGEKPILIRARTNGVRESVLGHGHDVGSRLGNAGSINSGAERQLGQSQVASERPPIKIHDTGKPGIAITPTGGELNTRNAIVEGDDLIASQRDDMTHNPDYPQVLQNRDRTTAASQAQISKLASKLNPRLLMDNPLSSEGAPIVSKDGVVESGNGRTLAIRKAYAEHPESAAKYKSALQKAGYNIDGVKNPVLVRVRETPMTGAQRVKLAHDSNVRTTSGLSATEQAAQDGNKISSGTLDKFQGGDIKLLQNRNFIRSAIQDMIPDSEQASVLGKDGGLTQEAERRIGNALLSRAYDDKNITRLLTEGTDNELASLGKALVQAAPMWAKMREAAESGAIPKSVDITPALTDATKLILRSRREGKPLSDYFRTKDMFSKDIDMRTKNIIKFLYNKELTRLRSADSITKVLTNYARKAEQTPSGINLFGEKPIEPNEILESSDDDETNRAK